ncbi:DUF1453 domain-containing protein [Actinomadura harenae]|uniref:DUF1453 domain-containing protein n=1 Tax=Actinomadura harenae TaxID=2483351 RepID=A0A3M2MCF3_9ACTN|nr:DUF1453 domain-containing protein [Actinomadura harenae]RMI46325.1 DUF1453 domain-containing protein [Actinomadura harenae]
MSTTANVLLVLLVLGLVLRRQLTARQINEAKMYTLPAVLVIVGVAQGGLIDRAHEALSVWLLVVEAAAGLVLGAMRAATMRLWREPDGTLWRRGGGLTIVAWIVSIAVRVGLLGIAYALGVRTGSGNLIAFLGVSLLAQYAILDLRSRSLPARGTGVNFTV